MNKTQRNAIFLCMLTEARRQACKIALMGWNSHQCNFMGRNVIWRNFYALKITVNSKPSAESQITLHRPWNLSGNAHPFYRLIIWAQRASLRSFPRKLFFFLVSLVATFIGNKYLLSKMSIFFSSAINRAHLTCWLQPQLNAQMSLICVSIATTKFLRKKHTGVHFTRNKGCSASMESATKDGRLDSWPARACAHTKLLR